MASPLPLSSSERREEELDLAEQLWFGERGPGGTALAWPLARHGSEHGQANLLRAWLSVRCPPPLDKLIVVLLKMGRSFSELQAYNGYEPRGRRAHESSYLHYYNNTPL
jgi:hypothetical protein